MPSGDQPVWTLARSATRPSRAPPNYLRTCAPPIAHNVAAGRAIWSRLGQSLARDTSSMPPVRSTPRRARSAHLRERCGSRFLRRTEGRERGVLRVSLPCKAVHSRGRALGTKPVLVPKSSDIRIHPQLSDALGFAAPRADLRLIEPQNATSCRALRPASQSGGRAVRARLSISESPARAGFRQDLLAVAPIVASSAAASPSSARAFSIVASASGSPASPEWRRPGPPALAHSAILTLVGPRRRDAALRRSSAERLAGANALQANQRPNARCSACGPVIVSFRPRMEPASSARPR